ncbi:MAG: hypothetical protein H6636_13210 [Anaerolineales bacterium]|nr:hypothetical protein [Anaerolineales bacterium]
MAIQVRDLQTYDEFTQVQALHRKIWGLSEGLYPPMLNTAAHNGGIVLGAFDEETMIGFSFAFLGKHADGTLKLCSQTTGLLPNYRHQGVGEQLKWEQFDRACAANLRLITWTVDPLEAPNALLNFRKLGGLCHAYHVNLYGEHFSAFGEGMPADRLTVEWWLDTPRVAQRRTKTFSSNAFIAPLINPTHSTGFSQKIAHLDLFLTDPTLLLEIPADIQGMRHTVFPNALDWRLQIRKALQTYFQKGYQITDAFSNSNSEQRVFLVLTR